MRISRLLPATALIAAICAAPSSAATLNELTPVSPKPGGKVASGKSASFKVRSTGEGSVWVHVCKSRKKNSKGVICNKQFIGEAKRSRGLYKATQKFFDYPAFWLNRPGTYYWQAYRINCEGGNTRDCQQEGPIVKFRVV